MQQQNNNVHIGRRDFITPTIPFVLSAVHTSQTTPQTWHQTITIVAASGTGYYTRRRTDNPEQQSSNATPRPAPRSTYALREAAQHRSPHILCKKTQSKGIARELQ